MHDTYLKKLQSSMNTLFVVDDTKDTTHHQRPASFSACVKIHSRALMPSSSSSPASGTPVPLRVLSLHSSIGRTK